MWSGFEGDKDVFVLCWNVWFTWWHYFCHGEGELNLGKWEVHMILGGIVPESYDLCCMLHIRFWRLLFLCETITGTLYLNIPESFLIPQSTKCSLHRNVVFQQDNTLPHFHAKVRFAGCQIPRSAERTSCTISVAHWTWFQWTVPLGNN